MTRDDCVALDIEDPLAAHRGAFVVPAGVIYLDGNSLGALPLAARDRIARVVEHEWGDGLIRSWNAAHWIELPRRVGTKIAHLVGAQPDEVICADSTSINLFKVLATALRLQALRPQAPQVSLRERNVILSEKTNFPTDLYVAQGVINLLGQGHELRLVEFDEVADAIDDRTAVVMLTHVNFRTGAMHDMSALTSRAHGAGALTLWDLSHSVGAVPVDLNMAAADFAVGCGYKYLNGGPGAPAFVFVAGRHLAAIADDTYAQPLAGWLGHHAPFEFAVDYRPAASIDRYAVGTPSIIALSALEVGVDTVLAAGIHALRAKSIALTQLFVDLVEQRCAVLGLSLVSPRNAAHRGSQVCLSHPHAYAVMQALINRSVIGDFRAPDIVRFGFAPLYVGYADVWDAVQALHQVLAEHEWQRTEFQTREAVT
ncbi:MAG: kynureninase [Burkholderiaceae bacterium]